MMTTPNHMKGFTLVETLVAIAILMIAMVAPYYSVQQAITSSYVSRDQLIATSRAQEGTEYIYFLRDNNYLSGQSWTQGMAPCLTSSGCTIDASTGVVAACGSSCAALQLTSSGIYTQTGSSPVTKFTRIVRITIISKHIINS